MLRIYRHLHVAVEWTDWRSLELSEKQRTVSNREALDSKILPFGVGMLKWRDA